MRLLLRLLLLLMIIIIILGHNIVGTMQRRRCYPELRILGLLRFSLTILSQLLQEPTKLGLISAPGGLQYFN